MATWAFTAAGEASTGPVSSHRSRVIPTAGSVTQQAVQLGAPAFGELVGQPVEGLPSRVLPGVGDPFHDHHRPRRITRAEIRYSHASRNNSSGESCSSARASRNSSTSFNSSGPAARHPRYRAASRRCYVRVFARRPYNRSASGST